MAEEPGVGATRPTVAEEAAAAVMALPEARRNGVLPSLVSYLAFDAPTVDPLPFMFLRGGAASPDVLGRARRFAVGGRLLVARVRWLDEMVDCGEPLGQPVDVHRLSMAVHREALSRFSSGLDGGRAAAHFFGLLSGLEARYAASVAIDASSSAVPLTGREPARVSLGSYAEQAKARAMVASAPVEAMMIVTGTGEEEKRSARACLEALAVAWQLGDDVLDLEEDYRDGRLSWIVSETLRGLTGDGLPPEPDAFYEAALFGGHVQRGLEESLVRYREAEHKAGGLFPEVVRFARGEIQRTTEMLADLETIVSSGGRI